jgi:hypothetical protein
MSNFRTYFFIIGDEHQGYKESMMREKKIVKNSALNVPTICQISYKRTKKHNDSRNDFNEEIEENEQTSRKIW